VRIGGGGRDRVQHAHPRRDSRSRTVPAQHNVRRWGLLAACRTGGANRPGMSRPPQRWLGFVKSGARKLDHRGSWGIRLQTPRAGRRRNGGLAVLTTGRGFIERHRPARSSREDRARGSVGTPASRAALTGQRSLRRGPRATTSGRRSVGSTGKPQGRRTMRLRDIRRSWRVRRINRAVDSPRGGPWGRTWGA
jgi:hypothetical protein